MSDDADGVTQSLSSISEGAGLFFIGKGVAKTLGLILNVILTRFLGSSLYGVYAYLNVLFSLITAFTTVGGGKSVMRFLPEYEDSPRKRQVVLTLAYGTALLTSCVAAILIYILAPLISGVTLDNPLLTDILQIAALVVPFNTLSQITYSVFKSIERMDYNVVVSSIAQPAFRLIFIGGAVVLGFSLVGAAAGIVVSAGLSLVTALIVFWDRTNLGSTAIPSKNEIKTYYNFSIPMTFNQLGGFLYNKIDLLMVGFFLPGSAVGIYNVSVLLSGILSLPLTGFAQLFPPIASKLYHQGNKGELESVYKTVTRLIFTITLFPAIAAFIFAPELLRVFGEEFPQGQLVLILFVSAQLTNATVGPSGFLLMMSDRQYLTLINHLTAGILNIILNYVLILQYGFIGAALATASVLAGINILRIAEVWYLEGILPYNRSFTKPIIAGLVSGILMYLLTFVLEQYLLLVIGGCVGGISFLLTLYYLGINKADIHMVRKALQSN
ncbi:flippase [Halobacterium salinarum]|uniref:flippase n=1 Tax=Halobacterium salinarum TaxID=2242 RepID=UPI002557709A|nr:flippase [Halobacterium salinarum]MDL0126514.1 flippase [Halobacterium salinarum]